MTTESTLPAATGEADEPHASGPLTDVVGMVDVLSETEILGWAWSPRHPDRRVVLNIVQGHRVIGSAVADLYRRDLEPNGVGDGRHAFEFTLPEGQALTPGDVSVLVEGTTVALVRNDQGTPALLVDDLMRRIVGAEHAIRLVTDRIVGLQRQNQATDQNSKAVYGFVDTITKRVDEFEAGLAAQQRHLEQLEVFALRFDEQLAALKTGLQAVESKPRRSRPLLFLGCFLAALLGSLAAHGVWGLFL